MGRVKEEWMQRISVLDTWQVWSNHFRATIFSLVLFFFYGVYLWIICSSSPSVFSSLLLFFSQISIGLPATRAYYDLGAANRAELKMFDSAVLRGSAALKEINISLAEIQLIFEHLFLDVKKTVRTVLDDYNDLSWFSVSTWAVVSTGLFYFNLLPARVCFLCDVVLAFACTASYLGGYWMTTGQRFEDDLDYLEYYALKRLKALESTTSPLKPNFILIAAKRGRRLVLADFAAEFKPNEAVTIEYHVGLPSDEAERFVIEASESRIGQSKERLDNSPLVQGEKWLVERVRTRSGLILRFINKSHQMDIANSGSYLRNPKLLEESSREFKTALRELLASLD